MTGFANYCLHGWTHGACLECGPLRYALSVSPLAAWAIVRGHKPVENRSYNTLFRGRIYVHAMQATDAELWREAEWLRGHGVQPPGEVETGAIIGSVVVSGVRSPQAIVVNRWESPTSYHWKLEDPMTYPAVPCPGFVRIWRVPVEVLTELHRRPML